jgi:hypothetical protein
MRVSGVKPHSEQTKSKATNAPQRKNKYTLMAYDPHQFDLIFASYFLHPFISLTLASSPIKKHVRYALSKFFMIGNKVVQKQFKKNNNLFCVMLLPSSMNL